MNEKVQAALMARERRYRSYSNAGRSKVDAALEERQNNLASDVDEDYINKFMDDMNAFYSSAEEDYNNLGWSNASSSYDAKNSAWQDLSSRSSKVRSWLVLNRGKFDSDTYRNLITSLIQFEKNATSIVDNFSSAANHYGQWQTEDAYNRYEHTQSLINDAMGAEDFSDKSGYVSTKNDTLGNRLLGKVYDNTYEYINNVGGMRDELERKRTIYNWDNAADDGESVWKEKGYDLLTDDEVAVYNYYYATEGKKRAEEYLDAMQESLNYRKANGMFSKLEDNVALELLFGVEAGLDQFKSGVKNAFNFNDDYIPYSATQIASGMVREDLADDGFKILGNSLGQVGYDIINTTSNMLPSILTSTAANFVVPGSGAAIGAGMMGTSAAGNAYQEMLNLGYGKGQARAYSTLIGVAEGGLQYALGGISKLGGKVTNGAISKAISGIDNGLARFAIDFSASLASEGIEEGLQEIISPLLKNAIFNTDEDIDWSQVAYSSLLGSLSAAGLDGVGTVANHANYNSAVKAEGNRIVNNGGVESLVNLANEMAGVSSADVANSLSKRVSKVNGKNGVNAKAVGNLSFAVNENRVQQNNADIVKALESKGIPSKKAQKYADTLVSMNEEYFAGEKSTLELGTNAEWKKITGDANAYAVLRDVVTDMESDVNKRNNKYGYARQGINIAEDGKLSLTDENVKKATDEILKPAYAKKAEGVSTAVSEDGKAKVVTTDAEGVETTTDVTINGIDRIETQKVKGEDGKTTTAKVVYLKVADADGNESVVDMGNVKFGSRNDAVLYESFVAMDADPAHFDAFIKNFNEADYDGSLGEAAIQYALGFQHAYRYGWANMETELGANVYASKLTDNARNIAYTLGKETVTKQTETKQKALDSAVAERKASGKGKARTQGTLHTEGVTTKKRTAMQNAGVGLAKRLTSLGIDVYLYESHQDADGNWVDDNGEIADNGFFVAKDGSIHIDLNAGQNVNNPNNSLMAYTLSHELVHFMRANSPAEFKVFADLLYKWYGKKGVTIVELVSNKMLELDCDWDTAYEEVVADSCESFLTDSNIADRIVELQETDKGTWEIIRDKVLDFLKWMKSLFVDVDPDSVEGRFVRQYKDEIDHLYDAFYNALASATETFQWVGSIADAKTNAETLVTAGITVDTNSGSAVMNSVRYAPKTQAEIDKVAKALSESLGVSIEKAKSWVKSETSLASIILDPSNAMFLDYEADNRYEAIKKNAEYPQGTVDFSNLCKKRREFTALLDKLQKEHPNRIITAAEMEKIRQVLIEENVEVACGLCYVEERRQLLGEIAQGFIDGYKSGTLKESIAKELDGKDNYVPTIYDLITYDGYRALTTEHPAIAKAFQKFNNARGMQAGRLIEGIAEYKRDILKWSQKKVDFVNSVGGLRVFSFSDFEATHLIDLVQVIQDCAVKGVMIQAYTKVPAFANAVKDTNMKVNRSFIAKGIGIKYESGRMVLDLDPVEGININDKDFFDSTNSESVGNVLVGMSDEQIRLAMKTAFVDYIIPFHTGLKGDILKAKKIDHWDNYKNFQTDKEFHKEKVTYNKDGSIKSDGWVVAEKQINIYVDVIQVAEAEGKPITNKVDFVNKFLAVAKERGLKPRFWKFLDVDANGEYVYTEGYHKFLVDFKLFDQQGNIIPQKPVVPVFDDALNARILNDYVAGKNAPVSRDKVYDRLENEVINGDSTPADIGVKHSKRYWYPNMSPAEISYVRLVAKNEVQKTDKYIDSGNKWLYNTKKDTPYFALYSTTHVNDPTVMYACKGNRANKEYAWFMDFIAELEMVENGRDDLRRKTVDEVLASFGYALGKSGIHGGNATNGRSSQNVGVHSSTSGFRPSAALLTCLQNIAKTQKQEQQGGVKKSSRRDSKGRELTEAQQEFFKYSKVLDADGNLMPVYHGTPTGGFTTFEMPHYLSAMMSAQGAGFYFTDEKNAKQYMKPRNGKADNNRQLYEVYLNITNPMEITPLSDGHITDQQMREIFARGNYEWGVNHVDVEKEIRINKLDSDRLASLVKVFNGGAILDAMKEVLGYDGVRFTDQYGDIWVAWEQSQIKSTTNLNPTKDPDIRYSKRQKAPTFYSYMGVVADGVKQDKLGAASVINLLKGKGVKDEEIKWSGIETWLEGKKSVTKAELQEFIAGSQLQIEEEVLDNKDRPFTEDQQKRLDEYESKRDEVAKRLADEWKKITDTDFPIRNTGAGLESAVTNAIIDANLAQKKTTFEGRLLEKLRKDLEEVVKDNDDFGFDSWKDALRSIHRHRRDFIGHYEMSTKDKAVIVKYCNALNAYNELPNMITDEDTDKLRSIALEADPWNRKIMEVKHEHNEEEARYMTKWRQYSLDGGKNYREVLFRIPDTTYSNKAMYAHWEERHGVLAHARIQDFVDANGNNMLFIDELQSDWHNEGAKKGYVGDGARSTDSAEYSEYMSRLQPLEERFDDLYKKWLDALGTGREDAISEKMEAVEDEMDTLAKEYHNAIEEHNSAGEAVPDAPFRDTYHEYVLKRLIRMAAEDGYDSIGWTTADTQMGRWNPKRKTNREMGIEDAKNPDAVAFEDGYRIEYDQDIPKFLRKYGKKWGATVGQSTVNGDTEVWSMPITDSMKDSVLYDGQVMYQRRGNSTSNRSLLANALESATQNDSEARRLAEYKEKIDLINAEEKELRETRERIAELSFAKGPKDTKTLKDLQETATRLANRINTYDKQLLRLEATAPLMAVLEREKTALRKREKQKMAEAVSKYREKSAETLREVMQRNAESRKKASENRHRTEMRHKIKGVVSELNQLLLHGTKDKHIKIDLQKATAEALSAINMDTVNAEKRLEEIQRKINATNDPDKIAQLQATYDRIEQQGENMMNKLTALKSAYEEIKDSSDPLVANAYHPEIEERIKNLRKDVGDTPLREMSLEQLENVYDTYKMVLHTIRTANKAFKADKAESISTLGNRTMEEVHTVGGTKMYRSVIADFFKKFYWNGLKPVYAFKAIGSKTLSNMFDSVRAGEDTWAVDVSEAKEYYKDVSKKYNYDSWDLNKQYKFKSKTGKEFSLSIEQIMSLYAYSKRKQADEHLEKGGFVFDESIEVTQKKHGIPVKYRVNVATSHNLSRETLGEIVATLSDEQKAFVDEMQAYLSDVMGAKGNEVSLEMFGVKLFKEKFYFPLKSAKQFMYEQNEVAGEVRLKNSGFSKETVAHANNPIILSNFMDVWANHVNDMSMYHAFVLPLEDFNRVFNYKTPTTDNMDTESVKMYIQNAYGGHPVQYIKQLLTDLNGGARTDPASDIITKMTGLFKKSAVFASASVVIQQPSAIARAASMIDNKYFLAKLSVAQHKAEWAEVKKYAPVAIIKEMGYFDTHMGRSTTDFIKAKEYDGVAEKMKGLFTDSGYRDEMLSKAPAVADELAWCYIWNAVKKEVADTTDLKVGSEEFLQKCGERFTEVVVNTQVYDSVLSRSAMMRSKDTGMKMATAFMAEPTTSINMIADAIIQGKRGNKKVAAKTIGAVVASLILNSILVSFVYAGRDDDEDKTYTEKYIGTLTSELIDSFNPLTMLPFVKDVISIAQGYDVERSDMAIISDLFTAIEKLSNDNLSAYRKVEDFGGAIASIFGLPVKNIMRDVRAAYNTISSAVSGDYTTREGIRQAVKESVTGEADTNAEQLYDAIVSGDTAHEARVRSRFKDEDAVINALKSQIKTHYTDGDISQDTALQYLVSYCGVDSDDAYWKIREWDNASNESYTKYDDFINAVDGGGNVGTVIEQYTDNGVEMNTLKTALGNAYKDGKLTESSVSNALSRHFGMDDDDIYWLFDKWNYAKENGSSEGYSKYAEFYTAVKSGVNLKTTIKRYTNHGVEARTLASQITEYFKPLYKEMSNAERANIKGYLLNAYVMLGYNRADKDKDINNWLNN